MAKIKICGICRKQEIDYVNKYRPDYVGFMFSDSRKQLNAREALDLRKRLADGIETVGVFVNEDPAYAASMCEEGIIDMVQLHGDEDEAYIRRLKELTDKPVIRAVRVCSREKVLKAQELPCDYLLLDAFTPGVRGESGRLISRNFIPPLKKPWFLSGGLGVDNLEKIMKQLSPYGFDISGGVESGGRKDAKKIKKVIDMVRRDS